MADNNWCAWCLQESGTLQNQQEGNSHGICEDHSNQLLYNYHVNRFNNVPSYVEQNAWTFAHEEEEAHTH